jgi:hypothetical protein
MLEADAPFDSVGSDASLLESWKVEHCNTLMQRVDELIKDEAAWNATQNMHLSSIEALTLSAAP